jgi:hypothetical protein
MKLRSRHSPNDRVPSSLQTQNNVLTREEVSNVMPALNASNYVSSDDNEGGVSSWGVKYTRDDGTGVHPDVVKTAMTIVKRNSYLRRHSTAGEPILMRVAVLKMGGEELDQVRTRFEPQLHWHKDGEEPLFSMVYILYNGEWDSNNSPGALEYGGRVAFADRKCGNAIFATTESSTPRGVRSGRLCSYYPPTNSLYIIPGYIVNHAVYKMINATAIRLAIAVFIKPRTIYSFQNMRLTVDDYLRLTWAIGFKEKGEIIICDKCKGMFKKGRQFQDHKRRVGQCYNLVKRKRKDGS